MDELSREAFVEQTIIELIDRADQIAEDDGRLRFHAVEEVQDCSLLRVLVSPDDGLLDVLVRRSGAADA